LLMLISEPKPVKSGDVIGFICLFLFLFY
jgi:hypothetical protein